MRLINGSGSAHIGGGAAAQCGAVKRHVSSIFAKLGDNEPLNMHRRVAAVLDDLSLLPAASISTSLVVQPWPISRC